MLAVAGVLIVSSVLSACAAPQSATPTSSATQSTTSVFTSRAQAGTAFRNLYESYLASLNAVFADGGKEPERLEKFLASAQYEHASESAQGYVDEGLHVKGDARVSGFQLQSVNLESGMGAAYICIDVHETRIIDSHGADVTPSKRANKQPLLVNFVRGPLITTSKVWSNDGVC